MKNYLRFTCRVPSWYCKFIALFAIALMCQSLSFAQGFISGRVTDAKNNPLPGVAVTVKNTTVGQTTDLDGKFSLKASPEATLVFTALGYKTITIPVGTRTSFDVVMPEENLDIQEVVVVGYGTSSRRTITSAITKVKGDVLADSPINSVADGLKGRVAGARVSTNNFQPGADPQIFIRGGSSINKSNSPLILVDGVERSLAGISPHDIESIEVLKDAASAAIYGSRASNGVVLVTLKKGELNTAPTITFDMSLAVQDVINTHEMMNATDYLSFVRPAMANSTIHSKLGANNHSAGTGNTSSSIYTTRYLREGEAIPAGYKSMPDPLDPAKTLIFEDHDWYDEMFKPSLWQNYHVGVNGGTQHTLYNASVGYVNDDGVALGTGYERFNAHLALQSTIARKFKMRALMDYSDTKDDYFPNQKETISRGLSAAPTMRLRFEDGTPAWGYNKSSLSPLYTDYITNRNSHYRMLSLAGGLTYNFTDDLKFDVEASMFNKTRRLGSFTRAHHFDGSRHCMEEYDERSVKKLEAYLAYDKTFNQKHTFSVIGGYSYMKAAGNWFKAEAKGASSDKIPTLSASPEKTGADSRFSDEVMIGYFGRINYDFAKKYLFTFTFRADGSSKFAPGNQWGYFPGASAGWVMSEENFMKNAEWLNLLKIRLSYGQTGNNTIGLYDALGRYGINRYDDHAGMYPSVMPNTALKWETTNQLDLGVDFAAFDHRVSLNVDYFRKVTKNLLFSKDLPDTSGFGSVQTNVGKVLFQGFDLELHTRNIVKRNFSWESTFTWSFVKNRVLELPYNGREGNRIGGYTLADGTSFGGIAEGEPLYRYYGQVVSHIIQNELDAANALYDDKARGYDPRTGKSVKGRKFPGDYEWVNRPGSAKRMVNGEEVEMINDEDKFLLGYTVPHSTGAFTNTFRYKGLVLNVMMDWALGHSVLDGVEARQFVNLFDGNFALNENVKKCWTQEGDQTKYAKFQCCGEKQSENFRESSVFNHKADYLCIREISLSYNLPKRWVSTLGLKDVAVTIAGNNLHYFSAVKGANPEFGTSSTYKNGSCSYPPVRRFSLGLKVIF